MNSKVKNNTMLILTAFIWGSAVVAQSVGMEYIGPFTFNSIRSLLGAAVLLPVVCLMQRKRVTSSRYHTDVGANHSEKEKEERKNLLIGGLCCGGVLCVASSLQQVALLHTTVGKTGFITALYILIVPILGLFLKKQVGLNIWIGVGLALVGMYFLCIKEGFFIEYGDFLALICSFMFAIHILLIDYFSPKVDGVKLSCVQFFVSGSLCAIPMLLVEKPEIQNIFASYIPLLYVGFLSCGVAYTLQIVAQKNTDPAVVSLILSMESVFAAIAGWLVIGETLSIKEIFGCVLVFVAILLSQLPMRQAVCVRE